MDCLETRGGANLLRTKRRPRCGKQQADSHQQQLPVYPTRRQSAWGPCTLLTALTHSLPHTNSCNLEHGQSPGIAQGIQRSIYHPRSRFNSHFGSSNPTYCPTRYHTSNAESSVMRLLVSRVFMQEMYSCTADNKESMTQGETEMNVHVKRTKIEREYTKPKDRLFSRRRRRELQRAQILVHLGLRFCTTPASSPTRLRWRRRSDNLWFRNEQSEDIVR